MNTSKRISVSGRNLQFLEQLSIDMDEANLTEVLNYLLTDIRLLNYQIGNKPQPQPQPQPQHALGYTFEKSAPVPDVNRNCQEFPSVLDVELNHQETDPLIQRLINAGLEMEF